ncbi:putative tellurite resistance protein B-like protein [Pacificibacter maritimus]|uniref:Putative tellurite resistance protein B-like protein n=2 Tax=Pacificibacter maritimus TaxID=762213 RepID=A0A3N4UK18_9RHOB|nr:putative tellurite resistance protein B-like protein [Pacificibacter maritimus]
MNVPCCRETYTCPQNTSGTPANTVVTAPNLFLLRAKLYVLFMFGEFLKNLIQPQPDRLSGFDASLALAALLVRIARADGHYDPAEVARITAVLRKRFDLDEQSAVDLRQQAETLEAEAPDTVRFTRAIKDAVPFEDRAGVIEAMWSVVLIDGSRDHAEDTVLRLVSNLLGLTDMESAQARQRASDRLDQAD